MKKQTYAHPAIITKLHPATDTKGTRISAAVGTKRIYVGYDHQLSAFENHEFAMWNLVAILRLNTDSYWVGGSTKDGYVWVDASEIVER